MTKYILPLYNSPIIKDTECPKCGDLLMQPDGTKSHLCRNDSLEFPNVMYFPINYNRPVDDVVYACKFCFKKITCGVRTNHLERQTIVDNHLAICPKKPQ